jgi:hypothetical protein
MATDTATFEAVADALIAANASALTKRLILAATMDVVGVPALSINRYRHDAAVVGLFAERGVRYRENAKCICGCLLGACCDCDDDADHGDAAMVKPWST